MKTTIKSFTFASARRETLFSILPFGCGSGRVSGAPLNEAEAPISEINSKKIKR